MASGPWRVALVRVLVGARDGEPHRDASVSRPNNAPGHANRCTNQIADALRSCSCRTSKLPAVWSALTRTQRLLRRACGRSALDQIQPLLRPNSSIVQCVSGFLLVGIKAQTQGFVCTVSDTCRARSGQQTDDGDTAWQRVGHAPAFDLDRACRAVLQGPGN